MSYMPFSDVISICRTDKKLHNICTSEKYKVYWKNMINNTYGNNIYYNDFVKNNPDIKYNYILYTKLIDSLDLDTQLKI